MVNAPDKLRMCRKQGIARMKEGHKAPNQIAQKIMVALRNCEFLLPFVHAFTCNMHSTMTEEVYTPETRPKSHDIQQSVGMFRS